MQPSPDNLNIEIPLTFDVSSGIVPLSERRLTVGFLILFGIVAGGIILAILLKSLQGCILSAVLVAIATTGVRWLYFNEGYYKRKLGELEDKGYVYNSSVIWDIYEIAPDFPVCSFKNGSKAVFVSFDKDIIVGKPEHNEYLHYEAIADAYQTLSRKNIECMHIDYMDTVGKDTRLDGVVKNLLKTPNPELRQLLSLVFEYQQYTMARSYSTYDVFAFYYRYNDNEFKDDLEAIINSFMGANYIRSRLLRPAQLRELVKSIYNIPEFSVNAACDKVFLREGGSSFIRVIYTERDGVIEVLNKTSEELAAERAASQRNSKRPTIPFATKSTQPSVKPMPAPVIQEPEEEEVYPSDGEFIYMNEQEILSEFTSKAQQEEEVTDNSQAMQNELEEWGTVKTPVKLNKKQVTEEEIDLFAGQPPEEEEIDLFASATTDDEEIDLFGNL